MQLTKEQFYNYIKEHGVTKAELTEDFKPISTITIPKGTILYFGTIKPILFRSGCVGGGIVDCHSRFTKKY